MLLYNIIMGILIFALGASIGSFLNVVVLRLIKEESFRSGRSYCPSCSATLTAKELIPIVSFLIQRGKCRNCACKISSQYPLVEFVTALSYLWAFLVLGFSPRLFVAFVLFAILIELSLTDILTGEIPYHSNAVIAALGVISFIISFIAPQNVKWYEHLIGIFIISVPFAVLAFFGAMGGGDVQLMAAAGFLLGWSIVPAALCAFIMGAVAGVIIKYVKKTGTISFGPYLAAGVIIGYLYGNDIIEAYQKLLII